MKKIILALAGIWLCASVFAQAPELKNMMPNSWRKLTRLSEAEEKAFFQKAEVRSAILSIDDDFFQEKKLKKKYYQVFTETNCGIQFYRFLISDNPLEEGYNREYKNKTVTQEECHKMQSKKECIWQIVFLKNKDNELQKILIRPYALYWASQGEWEGYEFNDLMIKPLNKDEIGFFITEISVAFTADREKMNQNIVPVYYNTCKNQIAASNNIDFSKYEIKENIISAWRKDGISIQASDCLFDSKCPLKYSIQNAFDGDPATSYVENTEDNLMRIVFRQISIRKDLEIKFSIINGYGSNASLYEANNRIKKCGLANGANTPFLVELNDMNLSYQAKTIKRDESAYTGLFEFVVTDIYKGSKYNDTCIAELNFWDNSEKEWLFGEINE